MSPPSGTPNGNGRQVLQWVPLATLFVAVISFGIHFTREFTQVEDQVSQNRQTIKRIDTTVTDIGKDVGSIARDLSHLSGRLSGMSGDQ